MMCCNQWMYAVAWLALCGNAIQAQVIIDRTTAGTAKLAQGDFAVPDPPALKLLDLDDAKLLRPVSVRALTTQLASASGSAAFIPRAFAVEFSPLMLMNGEHLSLEDYTRKKLWYRLRASLATKRGEGAKARTQVAAGLRIALQDDSDLRTNARYIEQLLRLTDWKRDSMELFQKAQIALEIPVTREPTEAERKQINVEVQRGLAAFPAKSKALTDSVKQIAEEAQWNANAFDLALGAVGSSADSTGGGSRFDGVSGWATKGWRLGGSAQLLLGARGAYERDIKDTLNTDLRPTGDGILRLYAGSNSYKVLIDAQVTGREASAPKWLASGGGELQLSDLVWITATLGWEHFSGDGKFVSSFKFKLNAPQ